MSEIIVAPNARERFYERPDPEHDDTCYACKHLVRFGHPKSDPKNMVWHCDKLNADIGYRREGGKWPLVPKICKDGQDRDGVRWIDE